MENITQEKSCCDGEMTEKMEKVARIDKTNNQYLLPLSIVIVALIFASAWIYITTIKGADTQTNSDNAITNAEQKIEALQEKVLPADGVELPVVWGDLGVQLTKSGAIDIDKFKALYTERGTFTKQYEELLTGIQNGNIKITYQNSGYLLNLFWALGLANKNDILEKGEMMNPQYGGAGKFASTGGWTMAKGDPMNHYSMHSFFTLTPEQQALVEKVSKGIYRPCCGNSVHFPDCNHGMAMLGLLELMASQGASEQDMWNTALIVNSYWFPDTYLTIATYEQNNGIAWENLNPVEVLGRNFSSAQGYANIASQVTKPEQQGGGGGCSV